MERALRAMAKDDTGDDSGGAGTDKSSSPSDKKEVETFQLSIGRHDEC